MKANRLIGRILILALLYVAALPAYSHAEAVDDMAKQILGAQQVDEVLSSFGTNTAAESEAVAGEDAAAEEEAPEEAEEEAPEEAEEEAETQTSQSMFGADSFRYAVSPVLPDNQYSESGSFDLRMEPGQEQTVYVRVFNNGTAEISVIVSIGPAYSNEKGTIQYMQLGAPERMTDFASYEDIETSEITLTPEQEAIMELIDTSYMFQDIVSAPVRRVTLKPQEEELVPFEIKMPEEPFEGVIMGGITLVREPLQDELVENSGMGIVHVFSYTLGMMLHESDFVGEPAFEIGEIEPNIVLDWGTFVYVNIINTQPFVDRNSQMLVTIHREGDDESEWSSGSDFIEFAPSSTMRYGVEILEPLPDGTYHVDVDIKLGTGEEIQLEETFTIGDPNAVIEATATPEPTPEPTPEVSQEPGPAWLEDDEEPVAEDGEEAAEE